MVVAAALKTQEQADSRALSADSAGQPKEELLGLFEVAAVDRGVLDAALDIDFPDYEDAVLHEAARAVGATAIVTRDRRDFANSAIPSLDPRELLAAVAAAT